MKKIFTLIRNGSASFMYLLSGFFTVNIVEKMCDNIISLVAFEVLSVMIILLCDYIISSENGFSALVSILQTVSVFLCITAETASIIEVFNVSSDNVSNLFGSMFFAVIIAAIALFIGCKGFESISKISNIIFFIPMLAVLLCVVAAICTGVHNDGSFFDCGLLTNSLINGFRAAAFQFSDIYIIEYMMKKEKICAKSDMFCAKSCVFALFAITSTTLILRFLFGSTLILELKSPIFGAVGIIPGFDFEEIMLSVYSVCILYRFSCRTAFIISKLCKTVKKTEIANICSFLLTALFAIAGAIPLFKYKGGNLFAIFTDFFKFFVFIPLPLCLIIIKKVRNKKHNVQKTTKF